MSIGIAQLPRAAQFPLDISACAVWFRYFRCCPMCSRYSRNHLSGREDIGLLAMSAALLCAYLHCTTLRSAHPLLRLGLCMKIRSFPRAVTGNYSSTGIGNTFLLPLLYQVGLGSRPFNRIAHHAAGIRCVSLKLTMPLI